MPPLATAQRGARSSVTTQDIRDLHLRELFATIRSVLTCCTVEAAGVYADFSKHRVDRRDGRAADCARARARGRGFGATRCSAASRSTSPRIAPCSTWRCECRARGRSSSTGTTSSAMFTRCSIAWARSATTFVTATGAAHRQADPERDQHRDRRLRPRAGDGVRGAAVLQSPRPDVSLRLERRRHRRRRGDLATSIRPRRS